MPFALQYKPFIQSETRIGKQKIRPRNVYRISSYKYEKNGQKSLTGNKSSLIFVIGIYDKKLICLKISELKPEKFFQWLDTIVRKSEIPKIDEIQKLEELLIESDRAGKRLFEGYVKKSTIVYKRPEPIYRTYNLDSIIYIQEVQFEKSYLKEYFDTTKSLQEKNKEVREEKFEDE
jgi:hypothetical protein